MYIYTGGEPLVRSADLITLCERHSDCQFLAFTNATLIDGGFADDMLRVKNFIPAISLEGFKAATDGRRGDGVYQKVLHAMSILRQKRLPFDISACYTSQNLDSISSDEFIDQLVEWGARFIWYFHYMPVGDDAVPALMPAPKQRETMYRRIRKSGPPSPFSLWTSKTTANMWAAALPEAAAISTSTPTAMWIPVCSSTIPIPTFGRNPFWTVCVPHVHGVP